MARTGLTGKLKNVLIGESRDLSDHRLFHKLSMVAFIAWVGLGADGLTSSCYGPEEAFLALRGHAYLGLLIGLFTAITVLIISASYTQIIELFPSGGGGYLVASKLLSPTAGVVSGCALLIDYVLTITISVASGTDALFSLLPATWHSWKLAVALGGVLGLMLLNLRGAREAVLPWVPVFIAFVLTHTFAIGYALCTHLAVLPEVVRATATDVHTAHHEIGLLGMLLVLLRSYSMGAGTYTGIEAVSNGLPLLREPRVETGRRTMRYMAVSLAFTVAGLLTAYVLYRVTPQPGKTLNAVLFAKITAGWPGTSGFAFVLVTLASEATLLFVAAQTGFLDGPRVLANMALDRWFPTRFAMLSDRFVTQNGILLMGLAATLLMACSRGSVAFLVVLYSINVFITFSLSQLGMVRHWWQQRAAVPGWKRKILVNGVGLFLTSFILICLSLIKFWEGGWITLLVTGLLVTTAFLIKKHYTQSRHDLQRLDDLVHVVERELGAGMAGKDSTPPPCDPGARTAVVLVNGFNGLGLHTLFSIIRLFPGVFRNMVFVQVGVVDAGTFKGAAEVENLRRHVQEANQRYVDYVCRQGFYAEAVAAVGTDVVDEAADLAPQILQRFPHAVFFGGQLVFKHETFMTRVLHNYVIFSVQRRFYQQGLPILILPIRV